ncbi:hypothetical protein K466DRAFT_661857 [Polyporus arcularius HHB13444]|uniref:Uncharacterized protein n=1 Tax=Polyporus arcularius HHB13444 TaxID=1314778 RepID=A0A5C3PL63_9APHY|nr:hypothetical protein K466DRAFT_661857 [Polyporus arcularius HHB13444]
MRVPPNMGMWFNTLMEAEKMEHLVVLTFPENRIPLRWRRSSSFDHSARNVDHVPQKLQSLETSFSFVERLPPFALKTPAVPLVALSLRGEPRKMHSILNEDYYPLVSALARTLRRLRVAVTRPRWHHHPLRVCKDIGLNLPSLEYLEVCDEASAAKELPRDSPLLGPGRLVEYERVNENLPGLRVLVWTPAWGDVEDLSPMSRYRKFIEDVRTDVFAVLKIQMFVVILPRERCVRFKSSDEEPQYTIASKGGFDDLDWRCG